LGGRLPAGPVNREIRETPGIRAPRQEPAVVNAILTSLPFAQFKRYPAFYLVYDSIYLALASALIAVLHLVGWEPPALGWWTLAALPIATYAMIMTHVFIHNASHGNFPKAINRIVGEICGVIVGTKFASWEIVHRRHHRYSDDAERDPHPAGPHYWRYVVFTLINVEKQLQQQYYDVHGDTPATRRYERWRSRFSFLSGAVIFFAWFELLGAPVFFAVYAPAFLFAALFVIFFNWAGHNAHIPGATIEPANHDEGIFWILNRMFFGIFYHANHHKMAMLFNPMKMPKQRVRTEGASPPDPEAADAEAIAAE
jgi:stearoyl-CoA desaturase (delta-9 desaturase)